MLDCGEEACGWVGLIKKPATQEGTTRLSRSERGRRPGRGVRDRDGKGNDRAGEVTHKKERTATPRRKPYNTEEKEKGQTARINETDTTKKILDQARLCRVEEKVGADREQNGHSEITSIGNRHAEERKRRSAQTKRKKNQWKRVEGRVPGVLAGLTRY